MSASTAVEAIVESEYEHEFITEIESDTFPPGLDEGVVRAISARKGEPEFVLEYRLKAFRHCQTLATPTGGRTSITRRLTSRRSPISRLPSRKMALGGRGLR